MRSDDGGMKRDTLIVQHSLFFRVELLDKFKISKTQHLFLVYLDKDNPISSRYSKKVMGFFGTFCWFCVSCLGLPWHCDNRQSWWNGRISCFECVTKDIYNKSPTSSAESAHTLRRMVLPKGTSFECLTQWDVNLTLNLGIYFFNSAIYRPDGLQSGSWQSPWTDI